MKKFRRVRRLLGLFFLFGFGFLVGLAVGEDAGSREVRAERVVVHTEQIEGQGPVVFREERVVPPQINVVVPEISEMPEIPEVPAHQIEIVHSPPAIFQVFRAASNLFASLTLIGLGVWLLLKRRRQQPAEKAPE